MADGRVVRRQRNQDGVLDAVIALFDAGRVEPAVEEVSEHSGVSTRSIYRYFHHREGLIDAALWHLVDRVEIELTPRLGDGPLSERLTGFVGNRLAVFGRIAPLVRASKGLGRPSPVAHEQLGQGPQDGSRGDGAESRGRRPLFAVAPSVAFAADFERVDPATRKIAEISADAMFQFDTIDGLAHTLASDTTLMTVVLERHLRQQIARV